MEQVEQSPEPEANSRSTANARATFERKLRDRSTTSSRSVASRDGRSPEAASRGRVKHEVPNTPVEVSKEVPEQSHIVTRRRGAAVSTTPTTTTTEDQQQPPATRGGKSKRKRAASEEVEAEQIQPPEAIRVAADSLHAPQFVLCTRNFPRTGAPIMNNVSTHKHASTFARPITEREAPGYRDLIYRPQDLKSIKTALSLGSRAVTAAAEAVSTPGADGDSPAAGSKNAVLMLQKTEDIIPPKGIVNSSQLEKELIRMFANAIMFNPVPQHGFGPAFPMISDEEDGLARESRRAASEEAEAEEAGIINDTLEMFGDVENAVTRWRSAERTAEESANKSIVSIRKGSVSDINADGADDDKE